ncbi:UNVERIFIED_CONTAM: hypothetical protein Sangu_2694500 [Sesamum angustifolium]|uniref:Integrator complex subunit 7-like C-terminal domain-containing protein n=1 Tax=Sesamum angustifolium TaxID=2727405 RepID=A0AAW2IYR5_9LAMI
MIDKVMDTGKTGLSNHEVTEFGSHGKLVVESKLMLCVLKIVVVCLQNLEQTDAETSQVLDELKRQAENAGRNAACQGAWSTAAFIFEHLKGVVHSASCSCWLKSLVQFSTAEKNIQLFAFPEQGTSIVHSEGNSDATVGIVLTGNYYNYMEILLRACDALRSAEEILAASGIGHMFSFQRWFLALRAKALETVVDVMKLLDTISFTQDGTGSGGQLDRRILLPGAISQTLGPLIHSSMEVSCRMTKLARELDFLLASFMGMDRQSVTSVSALALSCSLVAFTTEDLVGRLRHKDRETRKNLLFLLKSFGNKKAVFCQASQILYNVLQLLLGTISKLMLIPFRTPHHFFRVRPAVSSELFMTNEDGQIIDRSSIASGFLSSLSLCLQLKNMPASLPGQLKKVYCILMCKPHSHITGTGESTGQAQFRRQDHKIDDMMDLNEKLLRHVIGAVERHRLHSRGQPHDSTMVTEYVCFELNQRGQGFSTCLLDVASLPVGSYRIKWHSGFIDNGGSYWSLLPVNDGPLFNVHDGTTVR